MQDRSPGELHEIERFLDTILAASGDTSIVALGLIKD
jgi:hypothetical protein